MSISVITLASLLVFVSSNVQVTIISPKDGEQFVLPQEEQDENVGYRYPIMFQIQYSLQNRDNEVSGVMVFVDDRPVAIAPTPPSPHPSPFVSTNKDIFKVDVEFNATRAGEYHLSVVPIDSRQIEAGDEAVVRFKLTALFDISGHRISLRGRQHGSCRYAQLSKWKHVSNSLLWLACESGTDKVRDHNYDAAYHRYLEPLRLSKRKIRLLEIGIGCDMSYEAGASAELWRKYFDDNLELHMMEYDEKCALEWEKKMKATGCKDCTVHVGDQANVEFLQHVMKQQGDRLFDVIIDDGGHQMHQQKTSLIALYNGALAAGGLYFIEDLSYSYALGYGGGKVDAEGTTIALVKQLLDELHCDYHGGHCSTLENLEHFDCYKEICVFEKKTR